MRNHVDQNLCCRADSLPLLFRFLDQRFGFSVQIFGLLDDRSSSIEKINQRLGRWQGFLNLLKLFVAKAGKMADELNEPVFQHFLTSLVPGRLLCLLVTKQQQTQGWFHFVESLPAHRLSAYSPSTRSWPTLGVYGPWQHDHKYLLTVTTTDLPTPCP
jgi:hypothetical protein